MSSFARSLLPFGMSGVFFLSGVFVPFAPLPLLVVAFQTGFLRTIPALLTNFALIWAIEGWVHGAIFLCVVGPIALFLPPLLVRYGSGMGRTIFGTVVISCLFFAVFAFFRWKLDGVSPNLILDRLADLWVQNAQQITQLETHFDPDASRKLIKRFLPGFILTYQMGIILLNLVLIVRINPRKKLEKTVGVTPKVFSELKVSEFLIWPTIASVAIALFHSNLSTALGEQWGNGLADGALGLLVVLAAVYTFQGLCIFYAILEHFKVNPGFRIILYILTLYFATPLLIAVGFFDLWFDFRGKLRQSSNDSN